MNKTENIRYKEVIINTLLEMSNDGIELSLKNIVDRLVDFMIQEYTPCDLETFKRQWILRIKESAKEHNYELKNTKPDWLPVSSGIIKKLTQVLEGKDSSISSYSSVKTNLSSSVKSLLTVSDKQVIEDVYRSLDEKKMWKLSTGTIVELKMKELSMQCNYDHPCHSLIMDPEDSTWKNHFTEFELEEIRSSGSIELERIPDNLSSYLNDLKQQDTFALHKEVSNKYFDPLNDAACYWIQKALIDGLDIFMSGKYFPIANQSETDVIDRIWKIILQAFDQGVITARREVMSDTSSDQLNKKRKLSSIDEIDRQKTGKKPDVLFKYGNYEIGAYEAAKCNKEYSDKYISDSQLKMPKLLKGMLNRLLMLAPDKSRDLKTVGVITSGLKIKLLIMNAPGGYVCRLTQTKTYEYPCTKELFLKVIKPCLEVIWISRLTMEKTIDMIIESPASASVALKNSSTIDELPPCFFAASTNNKKRDKMIKIVPRIINVFYGTLFNNQKHSFYRRL